MRDVSVLGVGVDLCGIARIARAMERAHFMERVYTGEERAYLALKGQRRRTERGGNVCGEGSGGQGAGNGLFRRRVAGQIGVCPCAGRNAACDAHRRCAGEAQALGGRQVQLSLSHEQDMAVAFAP